MRYVPERWFAALLTLFCWIPGQGVAEDYCRPYTLVEAELKGPEKFREGLLWQVRESGQVVGHVFGTIHVDDPAILRLPPAVVEALDGSRQFVMETVPSAEEALEMSMSMFFMDGSRLDTLLPAQLFEDTVAILGRYRINRDMVTVMKPWAAWVMMSYPENMGVVLDVKLLEMARDRGLVISALESPAEQIAVFSDMDIEAQIRILADTVCHYDRTGADFTAIKAIYLRRDLEGLFEYSQRYSFGDDAVYTDIADRLIDSRNRRMVERIRQLFDEGDVFIAVGAMHLPGQDGILNLLEALSYTLERIY